MRQLFYQLSYSYIVARMKDSYKCKVGQSDLTRSTGELKVQYVGLIKATEMLKSEHTVHMLCTSRSIVHMYTYMGSIKLHVAQSPLVACAHALNFITSGTQPNSTPMCTIYVYIEEDRLHTGTGKERPCNGNRTGWMPL